MTGADAAVLLTALAALVGAIGALTVARARAQRIARTADAQAAAAARLDRENGEIWAVMAEHSERLAKLEAETTVLRHDAQQGSRRGGRSSNPALPERRVIERSDDPPIILDEMSDDERARAYREVMKGAEGTGPRGVVTLGMPSSRR